MNKSEHPLILVFYLNRDMMMNRDIITAFADSVNNAIAQREANCMAFFLPTDGEEKIEVLNPVLMQESDIERVNKIVDDLTKSFDIGQGADENMELGQD